MRTATTLIFAALVALTGCTAGGAPETDCAGGKCDAPDHEGEVPYESGIYDARFDPELSIVCEGGDVDRANLQPGFESIASEPSPLEDGPILIVRVLDAMRLEGEPCDTDGPSFRCVASHETIDVESHETIEVEEGLTLEFIRAIVGEWSAPDAIAGRVGVGIGCIGEDCDVLAEFGGLVGPEGEPRSFPCFVGWRYEATHFSHWRYDGTHVDHELPEAD